MAVALSQLRAFLAVADTGGFSAAADHLGVSQSAVSHAVAALERALGGRILSRDTPARPTPLGEQALVHARAAVQSVAHLEGLAPAGRHDLQGSLVLAVPPTVGHALAPRLMQSWRRRFPRVSVAVFEGDDGEVARWLEDATADLAVLVGPVAAPAAGLPLVDDVFHVVLREDHPLASSPALGPAQVRDEPFLLSSGGCERYMREAFAAAGVPFRPVHRVRQLGTLFAMVRAGIGVSAVPGLADGMLGPGLTLVPLEPTTRRRLVLTGPVHRPWHPVVRRLLDPAALAV